jgi:histidinol phosphatase-like PHP family hydrolase
VVGVGATIQQEQWDVIDRVDLHSHTTFSDGKSSLDLCVRAAEAAGLAVLAITDHLWQPGALPNGTADEYLAAIERAQERTAVTLLRGVETTALDSEGTPAIDEETASRLNLVLCDLGGKTRGVFVDAPSQMVAFLDALRRCMVGVAAHRLVDVLAHPFNVGRLNRGLAPDDLPPSLVEEVSAACAASGTAFEIMNDLPWWFPEVPVERVTQGYAAIVARAAEAGCRFTLGSDAHSHQGVGHLTWSRRVLRLAGVPDAQVVDWRTFGAIQQP